MNHGARTVFFWCSRGVIYSLRNHRQVWVQDSAWYGKNVLTRQSPISLPDNWCVSTVQSIAESCTYTNNDSIIIFAIRRSECACTAYLHLEWTLACCADLSSLVFDAPRLWSLSSLSKPVETVWKAHNCFSDANIVSCASTFWLEHSRYVQVGVLPERFAEQDVQYQSQLSAAGIEC